MLSVEEFKTASPLHRVQEAETGLGFMIQPIDDSINALIEFQKIVMAAMQSLGPDHGCETQSDEQGWIARVMFFRITS